MPIHTQFSESPAWLKSFSSKSSDWSGLSLSLDTKGVNARLRQAIVDKTPSLLDLRNYLFAKQCHMLFKVHRPWEVRG